MIRQISRNSTLWCMVSIFICAQVYGGRQKFTVEIQSVGPRVPYNCEEILLKCSNELDEQSLTGKIDLRDAEYSIINNCTIEMFPGDNTGKTIWIKFNDGFNLSESSKYYIDVLKGLRYVKSTSKSGRKKYATVRKTITFYFVTTSQCPLSATSTSERTKYIVISDIHIGGPRATKDKYNWFTENVTEFVNFLDDVGKSPQVKELIIAGDFMDEWVIPVDYYPFTGDVTDSDQFFESVINADPMDKIKAKLNEVADAGNVKIVYVPGNHDMLMSKTAWEKICPNGHWAGTDDTNGNKTGTGVYSPETGISIEHGHIYDFYNAPDSLSHPDGLLPPGFFISRMYAYNMIHGKNQPRKKNDFWGNEFFAFTWEVALLGIFGTITPDIPAIVTGIDNFTESYTYNQARDIYYNADIAGNWEDRQNTNGVYKSQDEISGLLTGAGVWIWGDLEVAAVEQYFVPDRAKIVVFGHTHRAMLKKYNAFNNEIASSSESVPEKDELGPTKKIYANSGTWVDKSQTPHGFKNRTYIVISPAQDSSALDTVSLYQYNGDLDGVKTAVTTSLEEANIHPALSQDKDKAARNLLK